MNTTMTVVAAIAGALFAPRGFVQRRVSARLRTDLGSPVARTVARAASEIARRRLVDHVPAVLRGLKTWSTRRDPEAAVVCLFLLDALVVTDAVVPAAALRPLLRGVTATAAFVLLARAPRVNELDLFASFKRRPADGRRRDLRWVAEGNLMCTLRTPGFAAILLRDLAWSLTIEVVDAGAAAGPVAPAGALPTVAVGSWLGGREGFPPLPAWSLLPAHRGSQLLAPGELGVACRRDLVTATARCEVGGLEAADALRAAWLGRLADGPPLPAARVRRVVFTGEAAFVAEVERHRSELLADRRRALAALRAAGALTLAEVVAANRPVAVVLRDLRARAAGPLPPFTAS